MSSETITPIELIQELRRPTGYGLLDVRSEGEFQEGALSGFRNVPILNNEERHQVGLTYKQNGQDEAIRLGHSLVDPDRERRVGLWRDVVQSGSRKQGIVTCWRGGLRSRTAAQWAREDGLSVQTVSGGYKAVRRELLARFERPFSFVVLSGWTGTGKTELLKELEIPKVDLEGRANHRGSSFGVDLFTPQPSQQTFENLVSMDVFDAKTYLIEDESIRIGKLVFPLAMKEQMKLSPVVLLEASLEERAQRIFQEYVELPIQKGFPMARLRGQLIEQLKMTERRLGGLRHQQILDLLIDAFSRSLENGAVLVDHHADWISALLRDHYDPTYQHSFERNPRDVIFRGDFAACREFLTAHFRGL